MRYAADVRKTISQTWSFPSSPTLRLKPIDRERWIEFAERCTLCPLRSGLRWKWRILKD
jgi:hypothetical protein